MIFRAFCIGMSVFFITYSVTIGWATDTFLTLPTFVAGVILLLGTFASWLEH